jgi:rhodanese-related sulfurtransferase
MAVDVPIREYNTEELRAKLYAPEGEPFVLVDTLPHDAYVFRHLPGAISLPVEDLEELAPRTLLDRDAPVIAYCSSPG